MRQKAFVCCLRGRSRKEGVGSKQQEARRWFPAFKEIAFGKSARKTSES
jgi:hypothetical protein